MQLLRQHRVDGVGRPKFNFHTGAYFAAKCTAHPREEGGTVFLIRIGHDEAEEQKEPELVEMRPVLPLADRALA